MINFRYHIVSITAVFLALGIGTALGSTFLDRYTVDLLDRNISSAEARINATDGENRRLKTQIADFQARDAALLATASPQILDDELTDVPVLVIAAPDVDSSTVASVERILASTGADLRGTLELSDRLAFADDLDQGLADDVGFEGTEPGRLRRRVIQQLDAALVAAGAVAPVAPDRTTTTTTAVPGATTVPAGATTTLPGVTTTTVAGGTADADAPDGTQPEILSTLLARGYVAFDPATGVDPADPLLETLGYRYVLVTGSGLAPASNEVLRSLLPQEAGTASLPAVVVGTTPPEPTGDEVVEPSLVAEIRDTDLLKARYSTVDDVETYSGLVATVLTLERVATAAPGHYGQSDGATAVLPPPP